MAEESYEEYLQLAALFREGDISKASKKELEHYAVMLSRPNAYVRIGDASYPQMCDTVRTLIMVRMSEEANEEATRISMEAAKTSTTALWVAGAALVVAVVQAVVEIVNLLR